MRGSHIPSHTILPNGCYPTVARSDFILTGHTAGITHICDPVAWSVVIKRGHGISLPAAPGFTEWKGKKELSKGLELSVDTKATAEAGDPERRSER